MYSIDDLAKMLKVSISTIRRNIDNGNIKAVKIGSVWRISQDEINRIMEYGF